MSEREIVTTGWDGASRPILRYEDEMHLPDHLRTVVQDRPTPSVGVELHYALRGDLEPRTFYTVVQAWSDAKAFALAEQELRAKLLLEAANVRPWAHQYKHGDAV